MNSYFWKVSSILFLFLNLVGISQLKLLSQEPIKNEIYKNNISLEYLDYIPDNEYILGPGDIILIIFNNKEIENKKFAIQNDGTIFSKRLRRIYIKGLTLNELANLLNKRYKEFFINPNINIEIVKSRPIRIQILGEVVSPGSYLLGDKTEFNEFNAFINEARNINDKKNNLLLEELNREEEKTTSKTLFDAIKEANGITLYSDLENIEVIRKNPISKGGGKIKTTLNFLNFIETGAEKQNITLMDGDTIFIKKSNYPLDEQFRKATSTNLQSQFNRVFISGRVAEPGMKLINKSATLNDLILLSGGNKPLRGNIYHVRFNNDGTLTRSKIRYRRNARANSKNNPILRSGDIVSVDSNFLLKGSSTISEITSPFVGIFSSYSFFNMLME